MGILVVCCTEERRTVMFISCSIRYSMLCLDVLLGTSLQGFTRVSRLT